MPKVHGFTFSAGVFVCALYTRLRVCVCLCHDTIFLSFRMQLHGKSFHIKRRMNGIYKINGGMYMRVCLNKPIFNIQTYAQLIRKQKFAMCNRYKMLTYSFNLFI